MGATFHKDFTTGPDKQSDTIPFTPGDRGNWTMTVTMVTVNSARNGGRRELFDAEFTFKSKSNGDITDLAPPDGNVTAEEGETWDGMFLAEVVRPGNGAKPFVQMTFSQPRQHVAGWNQTTNWSVDTDANKT